MHKHHPICILQFSALQSIFILHHFRPLKIYRTGTSITAPSTHVQQHFRHSPLRQISRLHQAPSESTSGTCHATRMSTTSNNNQSVLVEQSTSTEREHLLRDVSHAQDDLGYCGSCGRLPRSFYLPHSNLSDLELVVERFPHVSRDRLLALVSLQIF